MERRVRFSTVKARNTWFKVLLCFLLAVALAACSDGDSGDDDDAEYFHEPGTLEAVATSDVAGKTFVPEGEGRRPFTFDSNGTGGTVNRMSTGEVAARFTYDGETLMVTPVDGGGTESYLLGMLNGTYYLFVKDRLVNSTGSGGFAGRWVWESGVTPSGFYDYYDMYANDRAKNSKGVTAKFSYSNGLLPLVRDRDGGKEYLVYDGTYLYAVFAKIIPQ